MKKIIIPTALIATLAISYAAYALITAPEQEESQQSYHEIKKDSLRITITESGTLQAVKETVIKNELSGNSSIVFIATEGKNIKKGELVVELDSDAAREQLNTTASQVETNQAAVITSENDLAIQKSSVESEIQAAKNDITFAQMNLNKFIELNKQQQLRNSEIKINTAKEQYKLAQERYSWSEKLAKKGFETKNTRDRDKIDVKVKKEALEQAQSSYKMLELFDLPKEQAQLQSQLKEAKSKHSRVIKQGQSKIAKAKAAVSSAERRLALSKEKLNRIKDKLKKSKIYSPVDGLILYPKIGRHSRLSKIEAGATVHQNRTLVTIPNIAQMKVTIKVPEFHINKIKKEQEAVIKIESLPNQSFKGKVKRIAAVPESNRSWLKEGEKFFPVEVLVTDQLPPVKPSVTAQVEILVAQLENTLSVPIQAVHNENGRYFCHVKNLTGTEPKEVKIGMMNTNFIEIQSGLKEGEKVLLTAP